MGFKIKILLDFDDSRPNIVEVGHIYGTDKYIVCLMVLQHLLFGPKCHKSKQPYLTIIYFLILNEIIQLFHINPGKQYLTSLIVCGPD